MEDGKPSPSTRRKHWLHGNALPSFLLGELIGERVKVVKSSCRDAQGIEGVIADETLNTLVLDTPKGEKTVLKKGTEFLFVSRGVAVKGEEIACRPEDRTKKLFRKIARKR